LNFRRTQAGAPGGHARPILGALIAATTAVAGLRCSAGEASASMPSDTSKTMSAAAGASGGAGHEHWDAGPNGSVQDVGTDTAGTGGTNPGVGDAGLPPFLCPGFPTAQHTITLAVPRSRAMVSPVVARGILLGDPNGPLPVAPASAVIQVGEFLNYYRAGYDAPSQLSAVAELGAGPVMDQVLLQVGVQAPAVVRGASVITVLVDTSISMTGEGIARARAAVAAIVHALHAQDRLNLLTSNPSVPSESFVLGQPADPKALSAASALMVDGGDDFGGALVRAYQIAGSSAVPGALNRVVLVTAGGVPTNAVNLDMIANAATSGIGLVGVGVGPALGYDDRILALASQAGQGSDVYIDRLEEADAVLDQRFDEVMGLAATSVEVTVTLPAFLKLETPAPPAVSNAGFGSGLAVTNLGPGQSLVYRQLLRACSAQILTDALLNPGHGDITVDVAYTAAPGSKPMTFSGHATDVATLWHPASPQIAKANAVVAFAEALASRDQTRVTNAQNVAMDALLANDRDIIDPHVGILALLVQEATLLQP
jgi:Ca-activated chloride channel family protein